MILSCTLFLASGQAQDDGKLNSESYWSTHNSPIFYGAKSITFEAGALDEFDPQDPRFRVFARDFEDGDLTSNIELVENNVDPTSAGEYHISYSVADSHQNTTLLDVAVTVTPAPTEPPTPEPEVPTPEEQVSNIVVERTVYTLPAMPNLTAAGLSRQDNNDRQILGLALSADERVEVCAPDGNLDIVLWTANGPDTATIGNCTTLTSDAFAIPLVTTPILADGRLDHTLRLELTYPNTVSPLNYYHAGDTAATSSSDNYGIAESETIMAPVAAGQLADVESLNDTLAYYQGAVEALDQLIGLDLNPADLSDQNVRAKTFVSNDFLGLEHDAGLRLLAQHYLGNFEDSDLVTHELAAELFTHYAMVALKDSNRMQLADVEEEYNAARRSGTVDSAARVYALVNLLDHFEGAAAYAQFARSARAQAGTTASADFFLTSIARAYGVNVLPYLESWGQGTDWGFRVSDTTKAQIADKQYPLLSSLADFVSADGLAQIRSDSRFPLAYDLVSGSVLTAHGLTGTVTLTVEIPDFSNLAGKVALIKDGKNIIRRVSLDTLSDEQKTLEIADLPVGTYALQMPVFSDYEQPLIYITVREQENTTYEYRYTAPVTEPSDDLDDTAYAALRTEILAQLKAYAERVTEQELNDRSRNAAEKSALVRQFKRLRAEDQVDYAGLIARIERGGLSTVTYIGAEAFANSSKIKFYDIITAVDAEDGVMELTAENTQYRLERIHPDRLTYYIIYQITDSDGNTVTFKTNPVFISEVDTDDENNQLPELPDTPELPTYPNEDPDDDPGNSSNWLGGSNNSTADPGDSSDPSQSPSNDSDPSAPSSGQDQSQDSSDPTDGDGSTDLTAGANDTTDAGLSTGINSSSTGYNPNGAYYGSTNNVVGSNISTEDSSTSDLTPTLPEPIVDSDHDVVAGPTTTKPTQTPANPSASSSREETDLFTQISSFFGGIFEKVPTDPIMFISILSAIIAVILLFVAAKKYIELRANAEYHSETEINFEDSVF